MTEEEARKRWCPFSRPVMPRAEDCGFQPGNRTEDNQIWSANRCIASECMAWRWQYRDEVTGEPQAMGQLRGYCGLGGKP